MKMILSLKTKYHDKYLSTRLLKIGHSKKLDLYDIKL